MQYAAFGGNPEVEGIIYLMSTFVSQVLWKNDFQLYPDVEITNLTQPLMKARPTLKMKRRPRGPGGKGSGDPPSLDGPEITLIPELCVMTGLDDKTRFVDTWFLFCCFCLIGFLLIACLFLILIIYFSISFISVFLLKIFDWLCVQVQAEVTGYLCVLFFIVLCVLIFYCFSADSSFVFDCGNLFQLIQYFCGYFLIGFEF